MVDIAYAAQLPEERMLMARAAMAQDTVQEALQHLSPKAREFLKWRAISVSDVEARHLMGNPRSDGAETVCACARRQPGWIDFREDTLRNYKKSEHFMLAYAALLYEPLLLSATRIEQLSVPAVQAYQDLLDPSREVKDSVRRLAAKDILEASGLKQTEGSNVRHSATANELQLRMAKERLNRQLPLSAAQRALLAAAGVQLPGDGPVQPLLKAGAVERSLDGEDVVVYDFGDSGDENEAYLPD